MSNLFSLSELKVGQVEKQTIHQDQGVYFKFIEAHTAKIENIKKLCGRFPREKEIIFLWSCKSFNSFTFIPYVIKYSGVITELCFSTYSINNRIVESLIRWYDKGLIQSIYIYIAESIRFRMPAVIENLERYAGNRQIEIKYAWNHSKVQLIKSGDNYFVIEGSGNFSENAANEQYIFLNDKAIYEFRQKCFFNG